MSDEIETTPAAEAPETSPSASETVDHAEEPAKVDLGREAAKAAAKELKSFQDLRNSLPPEGRELLDKEFQSNSNRAVNEARKAWETKQKEAQEKGEYLTATQLEEKLVEYEQRSKAEREAYDQFYTNLGHEGILPGSEEYTKVMAVYNKLVESEAVNARLLLTEEGVKMLTQAAGVSAQSSKPAEPSYGYSKPSPTLPKPDKDYQPGDVQAQIREDMRKAMLG